ncbi:MAG TPA: glutamate-1-semialdehyde 2,1-aminomutase [Polyangiaceae bacterium]|jgi:glutamate-1-semialdehyde 2,1-aminomutase|nr:glutamate-1-semialdehyde 2,1-aminomutase [Polyangiaceae bacterium]
MDFSRSRELEQRLRQTIPGGAHTYAKGVDQFPELSPGVIQRGLGCHVWDVDGNEFIEYGMGLRAVTLGHAYPAVVDAVRDSLSLGTNFTRPAAIELQCAEAFLEIVSGAEMVKFSKDGSTADTAALKLARAYTGREMVAICADQPFFSYDDWFIGTTTMDAGIPDFERTPTVRFQYNDAASLAALFEAHPGKIAAVFLEAERTQPPAPGFLQSLQALCRQHGAVLVFDEMITGFRWHLGGAQALYGVVPDLSTFGKAIANGFSLSVLCGRRDIMRLGSRERAQDNVFLLSTTHGAETPSLAAAIRTMQVYREEPVVEHLHRQGERLAAGFRQAVERHELTGYVELSGRSCNLLFGTRGPDKKPSQAFRTLFLQETIRRGVLMPSLVVSYSHSDEDIDRTIDAVDGALAIYALAMQDGAERHLIGKPSRTVFDRR